MDIPSLRTLIVDNYDSYTFNLLQLWGDEKSVKNVVVIRNDQFSWTKFKNHVLPHFDNIIISPGPGSPKNASDFGICAKILELDNIPILGVCLGHQGIGVSFGSDVVNAKRIMHGRLSPVYHDGTYDNTSLFLGIPSPFCAVRYHSLVIDNKGLPQQLKISAWCSEDDDDLQEGLLDNKPPPKELNTIMSLKHSSKPIFGVQFHPEAWFSVCTEYGNQILKNFQVISHLFLKKRGVLFPRPTLPQSITSLSVVPISVNLPRPSISMTFPGHILIIKELDKDIWVEPSIVFKRIVSVDKSITGKWWLDSSRQPDPQNRFSYMGSTPAFSNSFSTSYSTHNKTLSITYSNGLVKSKKLADDQTFWDWMSDIMSHFNQRIAGLRILHNDGSLENIRHRLPFDFRLGMVGYFGYEMKLESMPSCSLPKENSDHSFACNSPDAAFVFATQAIIFDHIEKRMWVTGLVRDDCDVSASLNSIDVGELCSITGFSYSDFLSWVMSTEKKLCNINAEPHVVSINNNYKPSSTTIQPPFVPDMMSDSYIKAIEKSLQYIYEGQCYEICLTTQIRTSLQNRLSDICELYQRIRLDNPAPFSAFLYFPTEDVAVLSSSPEKFIQINSEGVVEMKPIKGTLARAKGCVCSKVEKCDNGSRCEEIREKDDARRKHVLEGDLKERAENLMIVDLIRNDLAQICPPHTVEVPDLMKVESYETVHQLVTTVRGKLCDYLDCVKAVQRCFPPGSMTGAPKLRAIHLLNELENNSPRGIYSGCLGYVSLQDGYQKDTAQFSVVIRTVVVCNGTDISIGAGGAIVHLSNPESEWQEVVLKSQSVLPRIRKYTVSSKNDVDPKKKAHSIIDSLPGNSLLTKTGYITVGTGLVTLVISKELYIFNEETVVLLAFIGLMVPLYRVLRQPFNDWVETQKNRVNSILDQAQEDHKHAVKERINTIGQLSDIVDITKALFAMSKETAKLEAEAFELKQKFAAASEIKSVLDSWVRYEASLREREQKALASHVMERVMAQLRDEKTQQEILIQSIENVESEHHCVF
ncbi:22178_t:CDS:10 [Cetraspora pellucida]|uniref:aminodeoxychorismate synthase n=1 Tax=Cetraspora pellucida TaxID=1433469 RepID=A0A9N8ZLA7_9GLOM|nr:22178_t:CDS:10 [Cetraspora pellucida]